MNQKEYEDLLAKRAKLIAEWREWERKESKRSIFAFSLQPPTAEWTYRDSDLLSMYQERIRSVCKQILAENPSLEGLKEKVWERIDREDSLLTQADKIMGLDNE